jgi:hypothetical protein
LEDINNNIETNSISNVDFYFTDFVGSTDSAEEIKRCMEYPMIYNSILRAMSRKAYNTNGMYANTIDYAVAIPNLDHITVCRTKNKKNNNKKKQFNLLLKMLNHKRTTRDILRHLYIDGMYVGILRDTTANNTNPDTSVGVDALRRLEGLSLDDNFMIQPLDLDYCKIIGFQNNVSIAAFDMQYFDQFKYGGLVNEIRNYPLEFADAYIAYKKDAGKRWFKLDYRKTIALKSRSDEEEAYGRPYGLSALFKMKLEEDYENSQYKLIQELASSIYYLVLPEGEKKGVCSLTKPQQEKTIQTFENAVKLNTNLASSAKISTLTLAPGTTINRLTKDSALLKDTLSEENMKKISTALGFASSALNAASEGGASYSSLQVNIDLVLSQIFQHIEEIATEITRVLNHHIGNQPKDYIDFKYLRTSIMNQDKMYNRAKELYATGSGSLKMWIASAGFDVEDYMSIMEEELDEGIYDKFTPHMTSYTISDSVDKGNPEGNMGGRPLKKEDELKPSGQATRNLGSNQQVKPSTKT